MQWCEATTQIMFFYLSVAMILDAEPSENPLTQLAACVCVDISPGVLRDQGCWVFPSLVALMGALCA